jgi:hypothetical protein
MMTKLEAALHPSAEKYREQAKLARNSAEFESNADERATLLVSARQYAACHEPRKDAR